MPEGEEVTDPSSADTPNALVSPPIKVAFIHLLEFIVIVQVGELPEHAPPHLMKVDPPFGVASSVTVFIGSAVYDSEQSVHQLLPHSIPSEVPLVSTSPKSVGIECGSSWWTDCSESYTA